jgi:hypothetical protein
VLRSANRQGLDPSDNLLKVVADGAVNLVVPRTAVAQAVFLPGPARYAGKLFKLNLGNKTSLEMEIRPFVAMHYAARVSWQRYSDESELVRVGPCCESERFGVALDRLFNFCDLRIADLALQRLTGDLRCFPIKYRGPS